MLPRLGHDRLDLEDARVGRELGAAPPAGAHLGGGNRGQRRQVEGPRAPHRHEVHHLVPRHLHSHRVHSLRRASLCQRGPGAATIAADRQRWGEVIRDAGIRAD